MGVGCVVGAGIFVLSGLGAHDAGPAIALSFLVDAAACLVAALSYAELALLAPVCPCLSRVRVMSLIPRLIPLVCVCVCARLCRLLARRTPTPT
jgi:L-asparagine transporter-like permease